MSNFSNLELYQIVNQFFTNRLGQLDTVFRYFYKQLYHSFQPDINGYCLIFMEPPPLSGISQDIGLSNQFMRLMVFAATEVTPPQFQVVTERIAARTGAIPFASEVQWTEQVSVSYIDNINLDIYRYHQLWLNYIKKVIDGFIKPDQSFIDSGRIDYAGSLFILRLNPAPDLSSSPENIWVAKCVGVFPQSLPNKELIGQRTANELTMYSISYFCAYYDETVYADSNHFVVKDFNAHLNRLISSINSGTLGRLESPSVYVYA